MQKMEAAFRNSSLITNYLFNTLTEEEQRQLHAWIAADKNNKLLFDELTCTAQQLNYFHLRDKRKKLAHRKLMRRLFSRTKPFSTCKSLKSAQQYFLRYISFSNSSCA
jgi:hypothetical protein